MVFVHFCFVHFVCFSVSAWLIVNQSATSKEVRFSKPRVLKLVTTTWSKRTWQPHDWNARGRKHVTTTCSKRTWLKHVTATWFENITIVTFFPAVGERLAIQRRPLFGLRHHRLNGRRTPNWSYRSTAFVSFENKGRRFGFCLCFLKADTDRSESRGKRREREN